MKGAAAPGDVQQSLFHFLHIDGMLLEWPLHSPLLCSYRPQLHFKHFFFFSISAAKSEPAATPPPQIQVPQKKIQQVFTAQGHEGKKKKLNPRPNIEALFFTYHTAFWDLPAVVFLHFNSISPVFVALIYISCSIFWLRCAEVDALMAQKLSCTHMTPWEHR